MAVTTKAELHKNLFHSTIICLEYIMEYLTKVLQGSQCSYRILQIDGAKIKP